MEGLGSTRVSYNVVSWRTVFFWRIVVEVGENDPQKLLLESWNGKSRVPFIKPNKLLKPSRLKTKSAQRSGKPLQQISYSPPSAGCCQFWIHYFHRSESFNKALWVAGLLMRELCIFCSDVFGGGEQVPEDFLCFNLPMSLMYEIGSQWLRVFLMI